MSKIQKALREMQKAKEGRHTSSPRPSIGTLAKDEGKTEVRSEVAPPAGDDTQELAALDGDKMMSRVIIDRDALRTAGFLAPEEESRSLIDQYRQIKRPLVAHAFGIRATRVDDGHLVLVSSALPGDGKTFTCINLALSLARERDKSVLLVDGDVAKGHVSKLFGIDEQPGLLDLLEKDTQLNLQDAIVATDVEGLSLMASGDMRASSTESLASKRMESLLRALTAQDPDRMVIIDSPPLLATSEARVLASLCGQIVLVVCASVTPQNAVLDAVDVIDESKAVNFVLNQARGSAAGGYYGGYGGYGGYGYGSAGDKNEE
jgi:exopolysaccharide/PEP-CTERM locus tyrosine autokinase